MPTESINYNTQLIIKKQNKVKNRQLVCDYNASTW